VLQKPCGDILSGVVSSGSPRKVLLSETAVTSMRIGQQDRFQASRLIFSERFKADVACLTRFTCSGTCAAQYPAASQRMPPYFGLTWRETDATGSGTCLTRDTTLCRSGPHSQRHISSSLVDFIRLYCRGFAFLNSGPFVALSVCVLSKS